MAIAYKWWSYRSPRRVLVRRAKGTGRTISVRVLKRWWCEMESLCSAFGSVWAARQRSGGVCGVAEISSMDRVAKSQDLPEAAKSSGLVEGLYICDEDCQQKIYEMLSLRRVVGQPALAPILDTVLSSRQTTQHAPSSFCMVACWKAGRVGRGPWAV